MEGRKKIESVKIETPFGSLESDSGNHIVDIISVMGVIAILYIGKIIVRRYLNG